MKKILILVCLFIFILTGCGTQKNAEIPKNEKTEQIEKKETVYTNLTDALNGYYSDIETCSDASERKELRKSFNKNVMKLIQGSYYYHEDNTNSVFASEDEPESATDEHDNRTILIKSKKKVYILPYDEESINSYKITADNVSDIVSNSQMYEYRIKSIRPDDSDQEYAHNLDVYVTFQSKYINQNFPNADNIYSTVELKYSTWYDFYKFTGFFADMISNNDDLSIHEHHLSNGLSEARAYYRSVGEAEAANERGQKFNQELKEGIENNKQHNEELKKSIPQIGMTSEEVEKTKWGTPDKINKYTYSWGTEEQWVYRTYGYVYLEDGVVTSVSENVDVDEQ